MRKINTKLARTILKRTKRKGAREWTLVSYSINSEVLASFKRACKKHKVSGSETIQNFMKEFIKL